MLNNPTERDFYYSFACSDIFGTNKISQIENKFGSLQNAWYSKKESWHGVKESIIEKLFLFKLNFDLNKEREYLEKNKINYLLFIDERYPFYLKNISNPPPIIFYIGDLSIIEKQKEFSLAIVGSRITTSYGEQALKDIMTGLDERFLIISGLAYGTDANAHRQAIKMGLKTGAIIGGPLGKDSISCPLNNQDLAREIIKKGGFIVSEFPPNSPVVKSNFPRRNRIIAGISKGTLVIEAGIKSGACKTAEYARDANRVVMAVPGSIYNRMSVGTNKLLKDNVDAVCEANDIYRCLDIDKLV